MDQLLEEILAQPQAIRDTVAGLLDAQRSSLEQLSLLAQSQPRSFDTIVLTGMGSSFYALPVAAIALQQAGLPCVVLEASELLHYQLNVLGPRILLVVVSQSGESAEIVRLIEQVQARGVDRRPFILSLSSNLDNSLARGADLALHIQAGDERSIAIKTHTCTQAALALIATALRGANLDDTATTLYATADTLETVLESRATLLDPLFTYFAGTSKPFLLARGWSQVSAISGALALKEGGHVAAEGMSVGSFRHGTLELTGPGVDVLIFASDPTTAEINLRLAQELAGLGARVAVVGMGLTTPLTAGAGSSVHIVELPTVEPAFAPLLEIAVPQLWSRQLTIEQGRTPGELLLLPKVVRVE